MEYWQLGPIRITRIAELSGPLFDPKIFFPDYDPAVFETNQHWLYPNHIHDNGNVMASMHSYLIETPHHKILVDSCIGNDKDRQPYRNWHEMQSPYLKNLQTTGVAPEEIDYVMCTHMHVDHVGWNTCLKDGSWVPTFPNAKYVFSEQEYTFFKGEREKKKTEDFEKVTDKAWDDSILPILDLAEMTQGETEIIADQLRIIPTPGHTPGSISISLTTNGQEALFTGDVTHHPIQVIKPAWNSAFCELPDQARATRGKVLEHCEQHQSLMMPAHFNVGFVGFVHASDSGFSFDFYEQ